MIFCRVRFRGRSTGATGSGALIAPVADFFEAFAPGLLEQADAMAGMLKFVDVSPNFRQPMFFVDGAFAASSAAGVQPADDRPGRRLVRGAGKLDEDAADFLDVFVSVDDVLVAQEEAKSQFVGFRLGLGAGLKGAVLSSQLLDGVAGHPEAFFRGHFLPRITTAGLVTSQKLGRTLGEMQFKCRWSALKCLTKVYFASATPG